MKKRPYGCCRGIKGQAKARMKARIRNLTKARNKFKKRR